MKLSALFIIFGTAVGMSAPMERASAADGTEHVRTPDVVHFALPKPSGSVLFRITHSMCRLFSGIDTTSVPRRTEGLSDPRFGSLRHMPPVSMSAAWINRGNSRNPVPPKAIVNGHRRGTVAVITYVYKPHTKDERMLLADYWAGLQLRPTPMIALPGDVRIGHLATCQFHKANREKVLAGLSARSKDDRALVVALFLEYFATVISGETMMLDTLSKSLLSLGRMARKCVRRKRCEALVDQVMREPK